MNAFVELWRASFHAVNLPATLLLLFVIIYWALILLGMLDLSSFDVDLPDLDAEMDGDVAHPHVDAFLEYFNVRHIPVTIVLTFFSISLWFVGVLANYYVHGNKSLLLGAAIFTGNLIFSGHVAKFVTLPMVPLFRGMRAHESSNKNLIGTRVVVSSSRVDAGFGQAELQEEGPAILLNVRSENEVLHKGDEAVILQHIPEKDLYLITPLEI